MQHNNNKKLFPLLIDSNVIEKIIENIIEFAEWSE